MLIGREPDAAVLGEASAWMLARSVASASADPRLVELDASLDRVTGAVLALSRALAENVADSRDVQAFARDFLAMEGLPIEAPRKRTDFESFTSALGVVGALPPLLDLADAYAAAKRERGYVEFSDQVALALAICERHPEVVAAHRERARTVLLDEYQDTSVVQTRLLATLFRGHSVMAVGDPDQSIYGWRGASAANLARFSNDFADVGRRGGRVRPVDELAQSRRRPRCRQRDHRAPRRGDPEGAAGPRAVRRRRTRRDRLGRDDRGGGRARRPLVRGAAPRRGRSLRSQRRAALPHLRERRRLHRGTARARRAGARARHRRPARPAGDRRPRLRAAGAARPHRRLRARAGARRGTMAHRPRRPGRAQRAGTVAGRPRPRQPAARRRRAAGAARLDRARRVPVDRRRPRLPAHRARRAFRAPRVHRGRPRPDASRGRPAAVPPPPCRPRAGRLRAPRPAGTAARHRGGRERGAAARRAEPRGVRRAARRVRRRRRAPDARRLPRMAHRGGAARPPRAPSGRARARGRAGPLDPRVEGPRVGCRRDPAPRRRGAAVEAAHHEGLARVRRAAERLQGRPGRAARAAVAGRAEPGRVRRGGSGVRRREPRAARR